MDVLSALRVLWPLSESYEYADLLGQALSGPAVAPLPLRQAEALRRLRAAETTRLRGELEEELAGALLEGPAFLRVELAAALEARERDWGERETSPLPTPISPISGTVPLYAPAECVSYREGYSASLDWTVAALAGAQIEWRDAPSASDAQLARAHDPSYLEGLFALGREGGAVLTPETRVTQASEAAVRAGAGALVEAARHALSSQEVSLVASSPGSHHASRRRAGGTCLVNNLAVAAYAALDAGAGRVAVLDLDAHHGNGTQDILWRELEALSASTHQRNPFFPGTGEADEVGGGRGLGANLNLPLAPGDSWLEAVKRAVAWFGAVDLVLVELSADAHHADPASDLHASDDDFRAAGRALGDLGAPVVCELGSSLSQRAWVGGIRSFVAGLLEAR